MDIMKHLALSKFIIFFFLIILLGSCEEDVDVEISSVKYVAPQSRGKGNGESIEDAAHFMDDIFWGRVNDQLMTGSVEVRFLAGDYSEAYLKNGLVLDGVGNKDYRLTLVGNKDVLFKLPVGHSDKSDVIRFNNCQNIAITEFHFTGDGRTQYTLRITGSYSKNFVIDHCSWTDMYGIIYGATGVHHGASNVEYKNCQFKKIGFSGGSHMMYHSYGALNIRVRDCYFEDCKGDYVRFRARTDRGIVENSRFVRNNNYPDVSFIAIPCFNDVDPGDEWFGTNFTFVSNQFENRASTPTTNAIFFYHQGYSPSQFHYLLTQEEGELLTNGTSIDKKRILKHNFGIDVNNIRIVNNFYSANITNQVAIRSTAAYGATSLGWEGTVNITDLINTTE